MEEGTSSNSAASNVAGAIAAALDWQSSPDARRAAVSFLDSVKAGDVRFLASTSFRLVKCDWSSEIRLHAFKMLQHLVRLRWEELTPAERRDFANLAVQSIPEISNPSAEWALKSQTAALVAEIVRREGLELWKELLPNLVTLSTQGPIQAELVAMVLRWLPEDITVHNEDLEGDRRRLLLRGLTESLPEILPLLYSLLERHFGAALSEVGRQQLENARQHAAAVTATLNAINAYAEWVPLPDLAKYGIIHGCGFLLSSPDFRLHACEFFKLVSPRKRPIDSSASEFDSAMSNIFQVLVNVSGEFLQKSTLNSAALDETEVEFAECVCESLVSLGSYNLQCILSNAMIIPYVQQMLGFFQHYKLVLHYQSLLFWLGLIRDLVTKPKVTGQSAGDGGVNTNASSGNLDGEKAKILTILNDDICGTIMDVSFQRMLKKEKVFPGSPFSVGALELWSDDFEGKGDFSQYRFKLSELVRLIASLKPLVAGAKVSGRIFYIISSLLTSSVPAQDLAVLESMQMALENVVSVIFDGSSELAGGNSEVHLALRTIFEGLLQQLLSSKWTEPALVEVLAHYLDSLGPFLKYFPDAVGSVVNKLFELLSSLPFVIKDPSTNSARHARLQICMSFIRIAKAADKSILPHMKGIADTMTQMQRDGCLLRSEHNLLGEAFLVMASAAGTQQQQEVLAWLLDPLVQQWTEPGWQSNYLSEPLGLVRLCSDKQFMWLIYHTVAFFEKALKRSGSRKGNWNSQNSANTTTTLHPMASHLSWMLPPLLKLLRVIHSLWSPSISQILPAEMKAAMALSDVERYSLLGEGNPKMSKGALSFTDGAEDDMAKEGYSETIESDVRNWLKGIRDSGYNVLGLSMTLGDPFFKSLDVQSIAVALMENVEAMEFRHIKQLIHSVVLYLVRFCPSEMWEVWLEKLLHPLFIHVQQVLNFSWSSLLQEGKAKVPDAIGVLAGSDLKVEVMEEKLLRDLTREMCSLLCTIASPGLNTGLPSIEQLANISRAAPSLLKNLHTYAASTMVGFLLENRMAVPALQICCQAFTWTDGEAVAKVSSFCAAVVLLAISTNSVELRGFVSKDLFLAVIRGLELESNVLISAEMVGLCRDIFMHLRDRDPAPRQILLSLPCISPQELAACEEALAKTSSPKEQRQLLKSLLSLATGNKLKALAAQKSVNIITNVTTRIHSLASASEPRTDDTETIGLAAIF